MTTAISSDHDGPKYPGVKVSLSTCDGNSFAIMGRVRAAMKKKKVLDSEIDAFTKEAKSGDYDHLLQTCFRWVDVT